MFATPAPIPQWTYIPVREDAIIDVAAGTIALKSFVGPLEFTFSGAASFRQEADQRIFEMNFAFDSSEVALFGLKWRGTREPKGKTYSFFLLEDELAAVRSSSTGGTTLMCRSAGV